MKIGLLSDTHGYFDNRIFKYFEDCDEIWHAGDIGTLADIEPLMRFKPVRAVFGNIDDKTLQIRFPEDAQFTVEGLKVWMTHIGGTPPKYNHRVAGRLRSEHPDIFICGHSHMLLIKRDPSLNNMLFINPGAAGNHGFHQTKTLVRFELRDRKIQNMEVIELGKRGALPKKDEGQ